MAGREEKRKPEKTGACGIRAGEVAHDRYHYRAQENRFLSVRRQGRNGGGNDRRTAPVPASVGP